MAAHLWLWLIRFTPSKRKEIVKSVCEEKEKFGQVFAQGQNREKVPQQNGRVKCSAVFFTFNAKDVFPQVNVLYPSFK